MSEKLQVTFISHILLIPDKYCDLHLGLFLVRGDNIILFGDVDEELEARSTLQEITAETLAELLSSKDEKKVDWDLE